MQPAIGFSDRAITPSRSGKACARKCTRKEARNLMFNSIVLRNDGKKDEKSAIRWVGAFVALLALLCFSAPAALGQCTLGGSLSTWNIAGNGNWSTGGDWSGGEPNSASQNVC